MKRKAKLIIALGRGKKKLFDKRETIKTEKNKRNLDEFLRKFKKTLYITRICLYFALSII